MPVLTVADVAARYGVARVTVYRLIAKGALEAAKGPGGHPMIAVSAAEAVLGPPAL